MTIFEAGSISGFSAGVVVGGVSLQSQGLPGVMLGAVAGGFGGALLGILYGVLVLSLIHYFHVAWCAVKSQPEVDVTDPVYKTMRRIGKLGVSVGISAALVGWLLSDWRAGVAAALAVGLITAGHAAFRSGVA